MEAERTGKIGPFCLLPDPYDYQVFNSDIRKTITNNLNPGHILQVRNWPCFFVFELCITCSQFKIWIAII